MSKTFKKKVWIMCIFLCGMLLLSIFLFLRYQGVIGIYMRLNGEKHQQIEIHSPYIEKGIRVRENFHEIDSQIQIHSNLNTAKLGIYEITYTYKDKREVRSIEVVDRMPPVMTLRGMAHQIVFQNEKYTEEGVEVYDNSKVDLSQAVVIQSDVDPSIIGIYHVSYSVTDEAGNHSSLERMVEVVENPMALTLHYHYDALNNDRKGWWFKKANDHERKPSTFDAKIMEENKAFYIGKDAKVIYLTFDEGGNDITYIKEITEILNQNQVNASYFLTRNYIIKEADFMRSLVLNGHEIGNHTRTHPDMTALANEANTEKFVSEIMETQKAIYEVTQQMPPFIFRFPKGDFSERAMAMVKDLGYSTYFWSHAYDDYSQDVSKEYAYNNLVSHLHPGAIYLLHPANKGNYEAMHDFILEVKRLGYSFDLVSNIK